MAFFANLDLLIVFFFLKQTSAYEFAVLDSYYKVHAKFSVPGTESWTRLNQSDIIDKINHQALDSHEKEKLVQSLNSLILSDSLAELVFKEALESGEKIPSKKLIAKSFMEKIINERTYKTDVLQFLKDYTCNVLSKESTSKMAPKIMEMVVKLSRFSEKQLKDNRNLSKYHHFS